MSRKNIEELDQETLNDLKVSRSFNVKISTLKRLIEDAKLSGMNHSQIVEAALEARWKENGVAEKKPE